MNQGEKVNLSYITYNFESHGSSEWITGTSLQVARWKTQWCPAVSSQGLLDHLTVEFAFHVDIYKRVGGREFTGGGDLDQTSCTFEITLLANGNGKAVKERWVGRARIPLPLPL